MYDGNNKEGKPQTVQYAPRHPKKTDATVADGESESARTVGHDLESQEQHVAVEEEEEEPEEIPQLSVPVTIGLLVIVTVFVAVTAEWLVDSIDGLASTGHISKEFIGLVLLPIVGNAAEHVTAVTVSVKDKLTLSLGVAVGSSIQISLFVIPFMIILGWILGHPLTLLFDPFESIVLFFAGKFLSIVPFTGANRANTSSHCELRRARWKGMHYFKTSQTNAHKQRITQSNWLEGMILMCLCKYLNIDTKKFANPLRPDLIIATVFWFYPGTQTAQC